jgi:hypothetical protein
MQDNKREMHKIDEALYFVIEENNQVELTDNGIQYYLAIQMLTFLSHQTLVLKLPIS